VSLALWWPDGTHELLAWGHDSDDNNCTERKAKNRWREARESKWPMLFQNGMFDLDVAETWWDFPIPDYDRWHDTMFLLSLWDPHAPSFGLKQSAERLLDIEPDEQKDMMEWIVANVHGATKSNYGAYIWKAPYSIVRPYHKGDTIRTGKLFNWLYPRIEKCGMLGAYQRQLKLMPILLESARRGMRIDTDQLEKDLQPMIDGVATADRWLRKKLGVENVDSDKQLGEALYRNGILTSFSRTEKGQIRVSKNHLLIDYFKDPRFYHALQYRNQMATSINMFAQPWLELTGASRDGRTLHPNWVQVRSSRMGSDLHNAGARSDRIISTRPNFLNIPKRWKKAAIAGYVHPAWLKVPPLPFMRRYCLPFKRQQWGKRDFNQQELRLFGHYEEGPVMEGFLTDPDFDIHELVRTEAEEQLIAAGLRDEFDRDSAKGGVFGRIYGQGLAGLVASLRLSEEDKDVARIIQRAINTAVPSIREMDKILKAMANNSDWDPYDPYYEGRGEPLRTWGGRLYYCEEPGFSKKFGRNMTYEYKMLNYLIQPSGADVIKETLIRWHQHPKRDAELVVTVYDEIDFSCAASSMRHNQKVLKEVMLSIETDVPMLSDGETGPNWGSLVKYNDKRRSRERCRKK
jgi:DNA polymerase I-like protein with 3'-5' exonuclease and polymerase domains